MKRIFLVFNYLVVSRYNSEMIIRRLLLWIEYMHVDSMHLFDQSSQLYKDHFQHQHPSQSRTVRNFSEHYWLKFPWYRPEFRYKSSLLFIDLRNKSWRRVNYAETVSFMFKIISKKNKSKCELDLRSIPNKG